MFLLGCEGDTNERGYLGWRKRHSPSSVDAGSRQAVDAGVISLLSSFYTRSGRQPAETFETGIRRTIKYYIPIFMSRLN